MTGTGLLAELDEQRTTFLDAATAVEAASLGETAVLEGWNLRDVVAHVAFWAEHGADAIEMAATGRSAEFTYDQRQTDAMNAAVSERASGMTLEAARAWEERAHARLRAGVAGVAPDDLHVQLGNGDTVEDVIRYDGPDHYAEHAAHLRNAVARGR